ncbi:MAG: hypothetical protein QXO86_01220 [Nitrososphaerota archaeon]
MVSQGIFSDLRICIEEDMFEKPDYIVLITHSQPYRVADYSTSITLRDGTILEEMSLELQGRIPIIDKK